MDSNYRISTAKAMRRSRDREVVTLGAIRLRWLRHPVTGLSKSSEQTEAYTLRAVGSLAPVNAMYSLTKASSDACPPEIRICISPVNSLEARRYRRFSKTVNVFAFLVVPQPRIARMPLRLPLGFSSP